MKLIKATLFLINSVYISIIKILQVNFKRFFYKYFKYRSVDKPNYWFFACGKPVENFKLSVEK